MNRRTFLEKITAVSAASMLAPSLTWAEGVHRIKKVGLQVYTVRDLMKQDMDETLAKVAAIGYREVERIEAHRPRR